MSGYDFIFLGSTPNALAAAARLARAGRRTLVLEPRAALGGPVATEEFAPGFFADTGVLSAELDPEIAADLGVSIEVIRRDLVTSLSAHPFTVSGLPALPSAVANAVELLRAAYTLEPPPSDENGAGALRALGQRLVGLGAREMQEVLRLVLMPARDFFEEQGGLPSAARALLCGSAVRGVSEGPFAQGTLFTFLHNEATSNGFVQSTAKGGLGSLVTALAAKARALGAEIRTSLSGPLSVDIKDGAARGVKIGADEVIEAGAVVSDFDARYTLARLVPPYELSPEANRAVRTIRSRGTVGRVHLALRGLPQFNGIDMDALGGTLVLAPDVAFVEKAWDQAKRGAMPARPYLEITAPTVRDPSLAPAGHHILSIWIQYLPYGKGDAGSLLKTTLDALTTFAPGLPELILRSRAALPEALGRHFEVTEGHLYGGEMCLSQALFLRPIPGYCRYESPIEGLYLAGSAAHPGGYSGRSGWNFAGGQLARASSA